MSDYYGSLISHYDRNMIGVGIPPSTPMPTYVGPSIPSNLPPRIDRERLAACEELAAFCSFKVEEMFPEFTERLDPFS